MLFVMPNEQQKFATIERCPVCGAVDPFIGEVHGCSRCTPLAKRLRGEDAPPMNRMVAPPVKR
jgi:hypothetical protein